MKTLRPLLLAFPLELAAVAAVAVIAGCDENPSSQRHGALLLTTTAPAIEAPFTTADGWTVDYDRFRIHLSSVTVAGSDGVVAARASGLFLDQAAPGTRELLSASVRTARHWEQVGFRVGPASVDDEETTVLSPMTDADADAMKKGGFSVHVTGRATRGSDSLVFDWGFTTDTIYLDCAGEDVGVPSRPGLVVPIDDRDSANIAMRGDSLFSNDSIVNAALRFDAIAGADADGNLEVTLAELDAVPLDLLRRGQVTPPSPPVGNYTVEDPSVTTLGGFVAERTRKLVAAFRNRGECRSIAAPTE